MNLTRDRHIPKFNRVRTVKFHDGQLHCNCPLTSVWGIPCVHSICVASTMNPHWEYPSHRDVSVLWWKAYLQSAIQTNSTEQDNSNTIDKMLRKLQEEEIVGINISNSWLEIIPVHDGELPEEFKNDNNIVKCLNYPNSNDPRCNDFFPTIWICLVLCRYAVNLQMIQIMMKMTLFHFLLWTVIKNSTEKKQHIQNV